MDDARHSIVYRTSSTILKSYLAQNVRSAKVEKPSLGCVCTFKFVFPIFFFFLKVNVPLFALTSSIQMFYLFCLGPHLILQYLKMFVKVEQMKCCFIHLCFSWPVRLSTIFYIYLFAFLNLPLPVLVICHSVTSLCLYIRNLSSVCILVLTSVLCCRCLLRVCVFISFFL